MDAFSGENMIQGGPISENLRSPVLPVNLYLGGSSDV